MRSFVRNFYQCPKNIEGIEDPFYEAIFLEPGLSSTFVELQEKAPNLPKSWFELVHLPAREKIEFVQEYWLDTLSPPYEFSKRIDSFFSSLEDINIFLVRQFSSSPFGVEMAYSLERGDSFFIGLPPLADLSRDKKLNDSFFNLLPEDYLSFLKIHNGFRRFDDRGLIKAELMPDFAQRFQRCYAESLERIPLNQRVYDPKSFIPFYRDNFNSFACFYLGALYDSSIGYVCYVDNHCLVKNDLVTGFDRSFFSFTQWLCQYMEGK